MPVGPEPPSSPPMLPVTHSPKKRRSLSTPSIVIPPLLLPPPVPSGINLGSPVSVSSPSSAPQERDKSAKEAEKEKEKTEKMKKIIKRRSAGAYPGNLSIAPSSSTSTLTVTGGTASPVSPATAPATANQPRLKLLDYLIKPIQRICRYPLLLDQLKRDRESSSRQSATDTTLGTSVEGEVDEQAEGDLAERAGRVMRGVLALVDKASEREAHVTRAMVIATRMVHTAPSPSSATASASATGSPAASASSCSGGHSASQPDSIDRQHTLTPEFVASLGPCILAGALDVVHHPAGRAKYLGVFLYGGGYIILAKVTKGGKAYEPRHWFSLASFEMFDLEDEDSKFLGVFSLVGRFIDGVLVSIPFSFHLLGSGQHIQLAASCQAEKLIWIHGIQDALASLPRWTLEPYPSFHTDGDKSTAALTPATEESSLEWAGTLPTIQSLNESEHTEHHSDAPSAPSPSRKHRPLSRLDSFGPTAFRDQPSAAFVALSRRSSSHSVKAFFSPMTNIEPPPSFVRIVRPSSQVRAQVDQGLQDIFSEKCLAARAQAQMRDEELFPKKRVVSNGSGGGVGGSGSGSGGMTRSSSGLSITSAMGLAAKKRYDSVIVSRRKSSVDESQTHHASASAETESSPAPASKSSSSGTPLTARAKSLASRRYKKQPPTIVASNLAKVESEAEGDVPLVQSPATLAESPFPASHGSSTTSSNPASALPSPLEASVPLPLPDTPTGDTAAQNHSDVIIAPQGEEQYKPKRTRSMVDNVRFFFQSRPASPSPSTASDTASVSPAPPSSTTQTTTLNSAEQYHSDAPPSSFVHWWKKGSLRRRVQSSPEVPGDEPQAAATGQSAPASESGHATTGANLSPEKHMDRSSASVPGLNASSASASHGHTNVRAGDTGKGPANPRRVAFSDATPTRRRSLFSPSTTRFREANNPPPIEPIDQHILPTLHRKSLRNVLFFQRSNSLTPMGMDPLSEHGKSLSDTTHS